jgi:hypothetical protein
MSCAENLSNEPRVFYGRSTSKSSRFAERMSRAERPDRCGYFVVSRETAGFLSRFVVALSVLTLSCGYRSEQAIAEASLLCVRSAPPKLPDASALEAVLDGAREELSHHGSLGSSYPCLVVEVLRVDETGTGVSAGARSGQPFARGVSLGVLARGWVEQSPGGTPSRDTGDVRRSARAAVVPEGPADSIRHGDELRAAGERVGRALAARVLGLPEPADEAP